jgi:serine/threonine protein kinase
MPVGFIEVEHGPYQGIVLMIPDTGIVTVGRGEDCTLTVDDANVSRHHFSVSLVSNVPTVSEVVSANGTFVNGVQIKEPRPLAHGDTVRAGTTVFTYRELARSRHSGAYTGKTIGRYRVGVCVGSGGMGEVYKAVQQGLGRVVALKILAPELRADREYVSRFLHEARAAGQLNHPNVVQVFDVGEEDGAYYYSMEFIEGGSVQDLISGGRPLPQRRAADIILEAARALEFAEKKNIIHCDVKPDNLMLSSDSHVKLADLGIAKRLLQGHKTKGEKDGVFGSPYYMSPEQAMGKPLDHRTDIYSLGATFYRLLTGKTPFQGDSSREVMEKQVYADPPDINDLVATVHPALRRIIKTMMHKSPGKRYQSAGKLIADIERAMPVLPKDEIPELIEQPVKTETRDKSSGCIIVAVVIFFLILATIAVLFYLGRRSRANAPPALPPAACLTVSSFRADG